MLSYISKLFERLLRTRLTKYIKALNIITSHQFGFPSQHDTTSQLVRITEHITLHYNNRGHAIATFLDVHKAFDRVWHSGLIYKMHINHLPDCYIKLIQSFLHQRLFRISEGNY